MSSVFLMFLLLVQAVRDFARFRLINTISPELQTAIFDARCSIPAYSAKPRATVNTSGEHYMLMHSRVFGYQCRNITPILNRLARQVLRSISKELCKFDTRNYFIYDKRPIEQLQYHIKKLKLKVDPQFNLETYLISSILKMLSNSKVLREYDIIHHTTPFPHFKCDHTTRFFRYIAAVLLLILVTTLGCLVSMKSLETRTNQLIKPILLSLNSIKPKCSNFYRRLRRMSL